MNKFFRLSVAFALAMLFGVKAIAQEWGHSIAYSMNDDDCFELYDAFEMTNSNVALSSIFYYKSGAREKNRQLRLARQSTCLKTLDFCG